MTISVNAYCNTMSVRFSAIDRTTLNNTFEQLVINYGSEEMKTAFFNMKLNPLAKDMLIVPVSYRRRFETELHQITKILIAAIDNASLKYFFVNPEVEELSVVEVHLHTLLLLQHTKDANLALQIVKQEYQYGIEEDNESLFILTQSLLNINIPSLSQSTLTTLALKPLTFFVPVLKNL